MNRLMHECPFCSQRLKQSVVLHGAARLDCPKCGVYDLQDSFLTAVFGDVVTNMSVSGWLKDHQGQGKRLYLVSGNYDDLEPGAPVLTLTPDQARGLPI
jgi:hypothetical protein